MFEALPQNCLFNLGAADLSALLYAGHEAAIHSIEIVATCAKRVANLRVLRRLSPEGGAWAPLAPPLDPPPSLPRRLGCTKFTQLHVVTSQIVMFISCASRARNEAGTGSRHVNCSTLTGVSFILIVTL